MEKWFEDNIRGDYNFGKGDDKMDVWQLKKNRKGWVSGTEQDPEYNFFDDIIEVLEEMEDRIKELEKNKSPR